MKRAMIFQGLKKLGVKLGAKLRKICLKANFYMLFSVSLLEGKYIVKNLLKLF